ncbi:MAG: cation-translocating P-type ATPase [Firmicutes bacterium]|nr:cation-translocating P-type ATPase [Bacillota bacterium]
MTPYTLPPEELLRELETDRSQGLRAEEVLARKQKYGENKLLEKKKKTTLQRFADQFKDAMILILLAAAVISFVVVCIERNWEDLFEPVLIVLIVILNAIMGVYQEGKAFNMRSEHSLFCIGFFTNHKLDWAALVSALLVALVLFTPVRTAFALVKLPGRLYLIGIGLILVPLAVMELSKAFGLTKHQK